MEPMRQTFETSPPNPETTRLVEGIPVPVEAPWLQTFEENNGLGDFKSRREARRQQIAGEIIQNPHELKDSVMGLAIRGGKVGRLLFARQILKKQDEVAERLGYTIDHGNRRTGTKRSSEIETHLNNFNETVSRLGNELGRSRIGNLSETGPIAAKGMPVGHDKRIQFANDIMQLEADKEAMLAGYLDHAQKLADERQIQMLNIIDQLARKEGVSPDSILNDQKRMEGIKKQYDDYVKHVEQVSRRKTVSPDLVAEARPEIGSMRREEALDLLAGPGFSALPGAKKEEQFNKLLVKFPNLVGYADALIGLTRVHGREKLDEMAERIAHETHSKLDALGIKPALGEANRQWVYWDLAKQYFYLRNQDKLPQNSIYRWGLVDPLEDGARAARKIDEIVNRHIGWEVQGLICVHGVDPILFGAHSGVSKILSLTESYSTEDQVKHMRYGPRGPYVELKSSDLAELGRAAQFKLHQVRP